MNISRSALEEQLTQAALQFVSQEEAEYFASESVETHIRKAPRSNNLSSAISDLKICKDHVATPPVFDTDLASTLRLNLNGHGPLVYIKKIHDIMEEMSAKSGIALTTFTNGQTMHTLHEWVQGLAKRGLMSIAVCNGGPNAVAPLNGSRGIMGTNPMAFGLPGENGEIHCVDMATSEVPYFEILNAHKNKTQLKEGLAVDFEGNPTTDPEKALDFSESETDPVSNLLSIGGGYKGYYITYLFEIMTSALIGALSGPEMSPDYVAEEHGCVLIVFNPKALGTEHSFIKTVKALHSAIRTQTPKAGTKMVVPGDGNNEKYNQFDGDLEISDELWDKLRTI